MSLGPLGFADRRMLWVEFKNDKKKILALMKLTLHGGEIGYEQTNK